MFSTHLMLLLYTRHIRCFCRTRFCLLPISSDSISCLVSLSHETLENFWFHLLRSYSLRRFSFASSIFSSLKWRPSFEEYSIILDINLCYLLWNVIVSLWRLFGCICFSVYRDFTASPLPQFPACSHSNCAYRRAFPDGICLRMYYLVDAIWYHNTYNPFFVPGRWL